MKKLILFLVILVFSFSVSYSEEKEVINIGAILPLTGSQASWGLDAKRVFEILKTSNLLKDKKYRYNLLLEDGQCGIGNSATTAVKKLIHVNKVKFLVLACSGEVLQAAPIANKNEVISIGFACSHPDIKNIGKYSFRTFVDIEKGMKSFTKTILEDGIKKIAILTEESPYTLGIKKLLLNGLEKNSITYDFNVDETEFQSILINIETKKPDAYYLNTATPKAYQNLLKKLKDLKIDKPVYAYYSPGDSDTIKNLGSIQNGVKYIDVPNIDSNNNEINKIIQIYKKTYREEPNVNFLISTSYDAIFSIINAIEKVGPDTKLVQDYLSNSVSSGALGKIEFDENGDILNLSYVLKTIKNGIPKLLE